jgi:hypothetical protein
MVAAAVGSGTTHTGRRRLFLKGLVVVIGLVVNTTPFMAVRLPEDAFIASAMVMSNGRYYNLEEARRYAIEGTHGFSLGDVAEVKETYLAANGWYMRCVGLPEVSMLLPGQQERQLSDLNKESANDGE